MPLHLLAVLFALFIFVQPLKAQTIPEVPRYGIFELSVNNNSTYNNPFDFNEIKLIGEFTAPSGKRTEFPGFFDGNGSGGRSGNVWRLRFIPDETGIWRFSYRWSDNNLGAIIGSFRAVENSDYQGILRAYNANPYWLAYNGDSPVFLKSYYIIEGGFLGIPLDWAVANVYRKLIDRGYNHLQLNLLPVSYTEQNFQDAPAHLGQHLYDGNPLTAMRLDVWKRLEEHMRWLNDHSVGVHFFQGFDGKSDGPRWNSLSQSQKEFYVQYVMARLAPFANVAGWNYTWETSGAEGDRELAGMIKRLDPWDHLRTYHDEYPLENNFDEDCYNFAAIEAHSHYTQTHYDNTLASFHNKPVFMSEGNGLWRSCWNANNDTIRRTAWAVTMAGGSFTWNDLPGCGGESQAGDVLYWSAAAELDVLYNIITEDFSFHRMIPRPELLSGSSNPCFVLAEAGKQYLIYSENGKAFRLQVAEGRYSSVWVNAKNNSRQNAEGGTVTGNGGSLSFTPPNEYTDWLLLLKSLQRAPAAPAELQVEQQIN
jgi:hypothetical protein